MEMRFLFIGTCSRCKLWLVLPIGIFSSLQRLWTYQAYGLICKAKFPMRYFYLVICYWVVILSTQTHLIYHLIIIFVKQMPPNHLITSQTHAHHNLAFINILITAHINSTPKSYSSYITTPKPIAKLIYCYSPTISIIIIQHIISPNTNPAA